MRITAKELRIGNFILNAKGNLLEVTSDDISIIDYGESLVKPMPMSIDLLFSFGFSEIKWYEKYMKNENTVIFDYDNNSWIFYPFFDCIGNGIKFSYAHQLQNLWFSINNEELTYIIK